MFLESSDLQYLDLTHSEIRINIEILDEEQANKPLIKAINDVMSQITHSKLAFLKMNYAKVNVEHRNDLAVLRPPQILPTLLKFHHLVELSLSMPRLYAQNSKLVEIDDKLATSIFKILSSLKQLRTFFMCNWNFRFQNVDRTLRELSRYLQLLKVHEIRLNSIHFTEHTAKTHYEHALIQVMLVHLPVIKTMSLIACTKLTPSQGTAIGRCIGEKYTGEKLELYLRLVPFPTVQALKVAAMEKGRIDAIYAGDSYLVNYEFRLLEKKRNLWSKVRTSLIPIMKKPSHVVQ